jgi:MFS family permease
MNDRSFIYCTSFSPFVKRIHNRPCPMGEYFPENPGGKMEPMTSDIEVYLRRHLRYNVIVNLMDGSYFGLAWGFGSLSTVVTLFVSQLTSSALLIGLVPAIHAVSWQFPQLFTAGWVARRRRYKPMVLWLTIHERVPFLGLALIAWFLPGIGRTAALVLTFLMLLWQGMGAGFTANPWQSFIAKIIPSDSRGSFLGAQAAFANIYISIGAVAAGYLLDHISQYKNYAICFLITAFLLIFSYIALARAREPVDHEKVMPPASHSFWKEAADILRRDRNFDWFLVTRVLAMFASMGFSFYIVFALRHFNMDVITAGFMTAALTLSSMAANFIMGWLGDRFGHRLMLIVGALCICFSALLAWRAPSLDWFYLVFILEGLANVGIWTNGMAITTQFGSETDRPIYIGLSNTLVAPVTILAPIFGGWLADTAGFGVTFITSAAVGLATAVGLIFLVRNPHVR